MLCALPNWYVSHSVTVCESNFADAVLLFVLSVVESVTPAKSVGRAAVLKPVDPVVPGQPSPPAKEKEPEEISVAELAAAL